MSDFLNIDNFLPTENDEKLIYILKYCNSKLSKITNQRIL